MNLPENTSKNRIAVKVKPAAERMVKKTHPWIFENSIVKQSKEGEAGDLVIVFDQKKNKFLACGFYDPFSPIRVKLLQFHKSATIDQSWMSQKIEEAFLKRKTLLQTDTNSYRFIFGENDGLPGFIADVYDQILVVKLYSAIWLTKLNDLLPALLKNSECTVVVLRLSRNLQQLDQKFGLTDGQVIFGALSSPVVIFKEHGLKFKANVLVGHKTGYFLDHRHNRKTIGDLAKGKKVLDVFAYAGGFSVHALAGGAKEVLSVDISPKALEMAKENAALNPHYGKHQTIAGDAFRELERLEESGTRFDIVVIDPPSFAKQASEIENAKSQYIRLATLGAQLVVKGGILLLASCSSRITKDDFFPLCEQGIMNSGNTYQLMTQTFHDTDHPIGFPEGAYLKAGYWRRLK